MNGEGFHTPVSPCELGRPHTAICLDCRQHSEWIHDAAKRITQAADTATELLEMARASRHRDQRSTLVSAATILLQTISKTARLEIVDHTMGRPEKESSSS